VSAATKFILLAVSACGEVRKTEFETRDLAEEGKSLTLYGYTRAQLAEMDKRDKEARDAWDAAHPWRDPSSKEEKAAAEQYRASKAKGIFFPHVSWSGQKFKMNCETGQVRDIFPADCQDSWGVTYSPKDGEWVSSFRGRSIVKNRHEVKHAEIFEVPND
jgi:hypothetical protein